MKLEKKIEAAVSGVGITVKIVTVRNREIAGLGRRKVVNIECTGMRPGDFGRVKLALEGPFVLINADELPSGTTAAFELRAPN